MCGWGQSQVRDLLCLAPFHLVSYACMPRSSTPSLLLTPGVDVTTEMLRQVQTLLDVSPEACMDLASATPSAADRPSLDLVIELLKAGGPGDLIARDKTGLSALHYAVIGKDRSCGVLSMLVALLVPHKIPIPGDVFPLAMAWGNLQLVLHLNGQGYRPLLWEQDGKAFLEEIRKTGKVSRSTSRRDRLVLECRP